MIDSTLDPETIALLRSIGVLERVLVLFRQRLPEQIESLRGAVASGDLASARSVAHTLRGASAQIGALGFARLCESLEAAAAAEDVGACRDHLQTIDRSLPVLKDLLSEVEAR